MLKAERLTFSYPRKEVFHDISFEAGKGEFICLLGPNGAGKTTLFKTLLSLLKPVSGRISIDGKDIASMQEKERARLVAYIPQEASKVFNHTVKAYVLMGLTPNLSTLSSPKEKDEKIAIAALKRLGIEELKDRGIQSLSGGERQLVLIARALATGAQILLFDEPTSNLDWGNQIKVLRTIKRLTEEGCTAIVSTHNLEQALNYSDRIILLEKGSIKAQGSPAELAEGDELENLYSTPLSILHIAKQYVCIPKEVEHVVE